jgi:hypothetical protein
MNNKRKMKKKKIRWLSMEVGTQLLKPPPLGIGFGEIYG